jgi:hypothetical protein
MMMVLANKVSETFNGSASRTVGAVQLINSATVIAESVGGSREETIGGARVEVTAKGHTEVIGGSKTLVTGAVMEKVGGDITANAKGALAFTVGGPFVSKCGGAFTLGARAVVITVPGRAHALRGRGQARRPRRQGDLRGTVAGREGHRVDHPQGAHQLQGLRAERHGDADRTGDGLRAGDRRAHGAHVGDALRARARRSPRGRRLEVVVGVSEPVDALLARREEGRAPGERRPRRGAVVPRRGAGGRRRACATPTGGARCGSLLGARALTLKHARDSRIFQKKSVQDIVQAVLDAQRPRGDGAVDEHPLAVAARVRGAVRRDRLGLRAAAACRTRASASP